MSTTEARLVVARKPHSCDRCGGRIAKGHRHYTWRCFDRWDPPYRCHTHRWCETHNIGEGDGELNPEWGHEDIRDMIADAGSDPETLRWWPPMFVDHLAHMDISAWADRL